VYGSRQWTVASDQKIAGWGATNPNRNPVHQEQLDLPHQVTTGMNCRQLTISAQQK
jgi:hypothetical protein